MALKFANGSVIGISTALAASVPMTAITNADPAVVTATGVAANDVVIVSSGWSELNGRVSMVGAGNKLLGIDTSDTNDFPAGSGVGSLVKVTKWTEFSQVGNVSGSGGEQQFWTGQFLERRDFTEISVPTTRSAANMQIQLYFDPKLPWFKAAYKASRSRKQVAIRVRLPDGDAMYYYGYFSFNSTPTLQGNQPMENSGTLTFTSEMTYVDAVAP